MEATMDRRISRVWKYAEGIRNGSIPACKMVKLAVERWYADWEREDLYFREEPFLRYCSMVATLKHFKGEFAGQNIHLEDWQLFIAANIFGWYRKETKARRYQYADVYVPRKNGKTTFAATIAIFLLYFDGEAAAEIYAAAVDKEQAKICFETAKELIRNSPIASLFDIYRGSIAVTKTASAFKPLTKDTKNKDGLNPHGAVCDERHAWKNNEIYDVIKTGIGARKNPLVFSISTAGTDTSFPYFRDLQFLREVMLGIHEKDNHFIMLYEPDEGDRWDDPEVWKKVNPNYGISLYQSYFENEFKEAQSKGGSTLAAFLTKNLNMWVDAPEVWISDDDVAACNKPFDVTSLKGQQCYVGIDLASKGDLTATAFFFPKQMVAIFLFCIPEAKIQEKSDLVDYRAWGEQGWITVFPGKVLDEEWYLHTLMDMMDLYDVKKICYDPWGMWDIKTRFGRYEERLMEYQQSIRYMSVPTKRMESDVLKHKLNFVDNPVIRWMFRNVVIYRDPNANIKLDKARSRNKIDGAVALADAYGGWLNDEAGTGTKIIYSDHGLRTV